MSIWVVSVLGDTAKDALLRIEGLAQETNRLRLLYVNPLSFFKNNLPPLYSGGSCNMLTNRTDTYMVKKTGV